MAHARTTDVEATLLKQCARGRRARNVAKVSLIAALARTNMTDPNHAIADVIKNETFYKAVFIAPCVCKVVRVFTNARAYCECAAGGTVVVKAQKTVIGGTDLDLCSDITISGESGSVPTADTAIDGTLATTAGYLDLIEGQLVIVKVVVSDHNVDACSDALEVYVEWAPMDGQ